MKTLTERAEYRAEGGGWVTVRKPAPELNDRTPEERLGLSRDLPGSLRYVPGELGIDLFGDIRLGDGATTFADAEARLEDWLEGVLVVSDNPTEDEMEAALQGSGFAWVRRDGRWAVPANENLPREITVTVQDGVVHLEAVLADWDMIGEMEREALATFLWLAQPGLRFARCHVEDHRAVITAKAEAEHLEADLALGLAGVAAGCRALAWEATALLNQDLAQVYLDFHREATE